MVFYTSPILYITIVTPPSLQCETPLFPLTVWANLTIAIDVTLLIFCLFNGIWNALQSKDDDCPFLPCFGLFLLWSLIVIRFVFYLIWGVLGLVTSWRFTCSNTPLRVIVTIRACCMLLESLLGLICSQNVSKLLGMNMIEPKQVLIT